MSVVTKDEELNQRAKENAKKAAEMLSPAQNYAIAVAGAHVKVGAFWGFTTMNDVKKYYDQIKSDENMNIRPIGDMCIVEVNPDYIIQSITAVDDSIIDDEVIERIKYNLTLAQVEFEKFLVNRGITHNTQIQKVAIYCTNQVTALAIKGMNFPAFRLTLEHALALLGSYGYRIRVNDSFIEPADVANDENLWMSLWETMQIAPTKTGVFIDICSTLPIEQYKNIRKQLKQAAKQQ